MRNTSSNRIPLLALLLFMILPFSARASSLQNLDLEKLYVKWVVNGQAEIQADQSLCWILEDKIFEGEETPAMWAGEFGATASFKLRARRNSPDCRLEDLEGALSANAADLNWSQTELSDEVVEFDITAKLPYSRFEFVDNEGTRIDLLVEARITEIERVDVFNFFKKSIFSARGMAIQNQIWQLPFLLAQYELPELYYDWLFAQIILGQSLFDFGGNGIRQGVFELGLGASVLGNSVPFNGPYTLRLRVAFEGRQINDQNSIELYPLLASQMVGAGAEFYSAFSRRWGVRGSGAYFFSQPANATLSKIRSEAALSYAFNPRWRIEAGGELTMQTVTQENVTSKFTEIGYFVGLIVKPYGF